MSYSNGVFGFRVVVFVVAAVIIGACSYDESSLGEVECGEDGDCPTPGSECVEGYCVAVTDRDVGPDDTDLDGDVVCEPETDEEFCERLGVECGQFHGDDNCGEDRDVDCGDLGFECGPHGECQLSTDADGPEVNSCECPEVDFEQSDDDVCEALGADCDPLEPKDLCIDWEDVDAVDCGGCEGDEACGLAGPNVCGCPCEIDEGCQDVGDASPDDPCMICQPEESEEEYTEADDGTACGDNRHCMDGECVCVPELTECDQFCVDTRVDLNHCGDCHDLCTTDVDGASAVCDEGDCEWECDDGGKTACEDAQVCADTETDPDHCGGCGDSCGENEICNGGNCQCQDGFTNCNESCVDTDDDPDHCGDCNVGCSGDNDLCVDGDCVECGGDSDCGDDEFCDGENKCTCEELICDDDDCGTISNACSTEECGPCMQTFDAETGALDRFLFHEQDCNPGVCAGPNCNVEDPEDDALRVSRLSVSDEEEETQAFVSFDTGDIPSDADIQSAELHLEVRFTDGNTDSQLYGGGECLGSQVEDGDWTSCSEELKTIAPDVGSNSYDLADAALGDAINPGGRSQFRIRSSASCSGENVWRFYSADHNDGPTLEVTWE